MALNINFGPTNDALRRMSFLMGQDWLGKQSQKRRFEYLGEQESMYGRLGDKNLQRQLEKMTEEFDIDKELTLYETLLKIAQDPTADRIRKKASVLREAGQAEAAADYDRQFAELIQGFAQEAEQIVKGGQVNWEGVFNIAGVDKGRDLMQKWQKGRDITLGFGELGEKKEKRLGEADKEGAKSQKSYYDHIKGLGNQAINYIKGLDVGEFEDQAGALTQKTKGNVLSMLRKLVARAKSGRLNREQELFLRDAMNIDKLKQMVNEQGEPIGFPGQAGSERGQEFMAAESKIAIDKQMAAPPTELGLTPTQLPSPTVAPGAGIEAGIEEKVQRLVTLILAEAQRQGKEITPEQAEELARKAIGR